MYPPPGSFRYAFPKPSRKELVSAVKEEFCYNAHGHCCALFKNSPLFKSRFWKIIFMVILVISTGHFSTIVVFPKIHGSLFLIYDRSSKKIPILSSNEWQSHHRKMNNLFPNSSNFQRSSQLNFMQNSYSDIDASDLNKSLPSLFNASISNISYGITNISNSYLRTTDELKKLLGISADSLKNVNNSNLDDHSDSTQKKQIMQPNIPLVGTREKKSDLKLCPPIPPNLEGPFKVDLNNVPPLDVQEKAPNNLSLGGRYRPKECQARHKVAIIIPFRDRAAHLAVFLYNIHPMLQRQQLDYAIFIVEQAGKGKFNRAMLMNIGSIEALKLYPYDCFIFHDIDLIPEDDRNLYTCPEQPRHMSVAINTFKYRLPYNDIFGGVSAMTVAQFKTVNGFSNRFWGWGGEDDDMSNRIKFYGFYISRYPANIARYTMISHKKDRPNPLRYKVLNEGRKKFDKDGLRNVKYKTLDISLKTLYTWINVELIKE